MVYMCGADLESRSAMATKDLQEMLKASFGSNVRLIIFTGGCSKWRNSVITAKKLERYVASSEGIAFVEDAKLASMGESSTLSDFITWGVKKFPADRTMLVFWDHGGGSLAGVCADELHVAKDGTIDTLTLPEMAKALKKANHHFDIVGFDTCLMATLETAQAVEPWADYLVASEESEPGGGWAYDSWPAWLAQYPGMDVQELARGICDSYYFKCVDTYTDDMATLSVTDLSKVPALANQDCWMVSSCQSVPTEASTPATMPWSMASNIQPMPTKIRILRIIGVMGNASRRSDIFMRDSFPRAKGDKTPDATVNANAGYHKRARQTGEWKITSMSTHLTRQLAGNTEAGAAG